MQSPTTFPSTKPNKRLLSLADFTALYGPCRTVAYKLINAGHLKAVKVGRSTFIPAEAAEEWAHSLPKYEPIKSGEAP